MRRCYPGPLLVVSQDEPPTVIFHHTVNTSACEQFWRMLNKHKHTFRSARPETFPATECDGVFWVTRRRQPLRAREAPLSNSSGNAGVGPVSDLHPCWRVGVAFLDLAPDTSWAPSGSSRALAGAGDSAA